MSLFTLKKVEKMAEAKVKNPISKSSKKVETKKEDLNKIETSKSNSNVSKSIHSKHIEIKGARLHNLKNIDVIIPRNKLTVVTGVSGSGKSSLAFDTLYAEGQRRFVESLSSYARQFLERKGKPDCDSIIGIPPAIAIEQLAPSKNPRSTVGTSTEIYDYIRLFFGRIGKTYCHQCGTLVKKDSPGDVAKFLSNLEKGTKLYLLFKIPESIIDFRTELDKYVQNGYSRIFIQKKDEILDLSIEEFPKKLKSKDFHILVYRFKSDNSPEAISTVTQSLEEAFSLSQGKIEVYNAETKETYYFSNIYECNNCQIVFEEPDPKIFLFNNPHGACPSCQGFGRTMGIDENLVIPDKSLSIKRGAIAPFRSQKAQHIYEELMIEAKEYAIPTDVPYISLTEEQQNKIWMGFGMFTGINGYFEDLENQIYKVGNRFVLANYRGYTNCRLCKGSRIRTSARQIFVEGMTVPKLIKLPLEEVATYFNEVQLNENDYSIIKDVLREIKWRLSLLLEIGLEYLTLDRLTHTLSGGEAQRINLSTAIGSSLVGTLYVLDEPSIGMHPRDTQKLIAVMKKLKNLGNTVVVVEHDPDIMKEADYIIDMGPKAGIHGGEVIFCGTYQQILTDEKSLTGKYLSNRLELDLESNKIKDIGEFISVYKPRENNLKMDVVHFPLKQMTVVTGVSGSGKSTLVHDVLYDNLKRMTNVSSMGELSNCEKIEGYSMTSNVEMVDQTPIGKSSRSTPATYTKVFDYIRDLFANEQSAKQLGWRAGYFSFNVPGGRCEVCEGDGSVTVDMQFLPNITLECEACKGTRYKREIKSVTYNGKNIIDVLDMTVEEAFSFFEGQNKIVQKLGILKEVGLGYIKLGQASNQLSGGEAQRIKLASYLESDAGNNIYIFDEPTTGLHIDDISKVIYCFKRLVKSGNTVIIIEHNLHVIASANHIIDIGPEAGNKGGDLVFAGTPQAISKNKNSHTGIALAEFYSQKKK